jgi:hypothetical protein
VYTYYFLLQAAKKSETLFQLIDVDKDGTLSEQEFLRVMSASLLKFFVWFANHYFKQGCQLDEDLMARLTKIVEESEPPVAYQASYY